VKQWEVVDWDFPHGPHPAIVLSPDARCTNAAFDTVNLLSCTSQQAMRTARLNEVLLNGADGFAWETLCRVDFVWVAPKAGIRHRRGPVTEERRREIGRKLAAWFGFRWHTCPASNPPESRLYNKRR
jgi:mRNA-degrading endonuclease toxin of MazEF toxin-antitoxin module